MKLTDIERALAHTSLPFAQRVEALNAVRKHAGSGTNDPREWTLLQSQITRVMAGLQSNRKRWPAFATDCYAAYLEVLTRMRNNVSRAARSGHTIAEHAAEQHKANALRAIEGRPPNAVEGQAWQSWAPQSVIRAMVVAFDNAYTSKELWGNRLTPFALLADRRVNAARVKGAKTAIANLRRVASIDGAGKKADTPHRALHLAACRQAERAIQSYENQKPPAHPYLDPAPIQWEHWLDSLMRKRLAEAAADPSNVSPDGLGSYL